MGTVIHRLKPHHIMLFSNYLIMEDRGNKGEDYIRSGINNFERYPQYEEMNRSDYEREGVSMEYGEEFIDSLVRYYRELGNDPDAEIMVVDGPDSFCSLGCDRLGSSCGQSSEESKAELMKYHGLAIGDVFMVSYISG